MKYFLILIVIFLSANFVFAIENSSSISSLKLNNNKDYDIEIVLTKDNQVLLPIKQLAKILEIQYEVNHSSKEIVFPDIIINKDAVIYEGKILANNPYYQKEGILDIDEYYVDSKLASILFDSEINIDKNTLSIYLRNKNIKDIETFSEEEKKEIVYLKPKKKGLFSLDTIDFSNSALSDSTKQVYLTAEHSNFLLNNNTQFNAKGELFDGKYTLNFNTSNYNGTLFSFNGLSFNYRNQFKNTLLKDKYYELGKVSGIKGNSTSIGTMLVGAQISNYDEYKKGYKNNEKLPKGDLRYKFLGGISGYNNRLFSNNGYIYQMNAKKLVLGSDIKYGINDKKTLDLELLYDKIIHESNNGIFIESLINDYSLLSSGVYKNPNYLQGTTLLGSLDLYENGKYTLKGNCGLSLMQDKKQDFSKINPGYSLELTNLFKQNKHELGLKLYNQSSDYYIAGSDSGFICDRLGAGINYNFLGDKIKFKTIYNHFYSNLNHEHEGGLIAFDEAQMNFSTKISKLGNFRASGNLRQGENELGKNLNYYYNLNLSKNFNRNFSSEIGINGNSYNTEYTNSDKGYKSLYNDFYLNTNYRLGKKGSIALKHDTISSVSSDRTNNYNQIKLDYKFPEFKRFLLGVGTGYKYTGLDKGNIYSLSLGYRTKTGMIISCNYQYNSFVGYTFNNMYIPSNSRHSINFIVNDTFAFANGLQSVGAGASNKGFVEVISYIDKNNNGKFDKKDLKLKGIPFKVNWSNNPIYTKRNGHCPLQCVNEGKYTVRIDNDNLLSTLSVKDKSLENIMVEANKTTRVEIPLISTVGNITGKLNIVDDFERKANIEEFIVTINTLNGDEVAYSTVDKNGNYYFSGISPGEYTISLDKNFIKDYNLYDFDGKGKISVNIPYVYDDFVEFENQDLFYKYY